MKRFGVQFKISLAFIIVAVLILTAEGYFLYSKAISEETEQLRNRILDFSKLAAMFIDGDKHSGIKPEIASQDTEFYKEIKSVLVNIRNVNPIINSVYTMVKTDKKNIWMFVVDSEDEKDEMAYCGEAYDVSPYPQMQLAFDGPSVDKATNKDKWGTWLSGYAPIKNSRMETVAIVGLDVSAKNINKLHYDLTERFVIILILGILAALILGWLVSKGLTRPLFRLISSAKEIENGNYKQRVNIKSNDEIEVLGSAFNKMTDTLIGNINYTNKIIKTMTDALIVIDSDARIKMINDSACELLGYKEEELINQRVEKIVLHGELFRQEERTIFAKNTIKNEEGVLKSKDEKLISVLISVAPMSAEENGQVEYLIIARDITHDRKAEGELELFRDLINQTNDSIFVVDVETGGFFDFNLTACASLKYTREEFAKLKLTDVNIIINNELSWRNYVKYLKNAGSSINEGFYRCKDSVIIPVEINSKIIKHGDKEYIVNVVRNISERLSVQDKQERLMEQLNKKNIELNDFNFIFSHSLKEPLRSIDAYSRFIIEEYSAKLNETGRGYIDRLRENTVWLKCMVEDFLEIASISKHKGAIEKVDTLSVINTVKLMLEYEIKEKRAEIIINNELPAVFYNRDRLTKVFLELICNSIKFSSGKHARIEIGSNLTDDFYEFYVKDSGIGIGEMYFEKIFRVFQKLNNKSEGEKENMKGTGAGLAIVKKIVTTFGGMIWVESKVGEGSTFYFTIPKDMKVFSPKKKIGEILIEKNLISKEKMEQVLREQKDIN